MSVEILKTDMKREKIMKTMQQNIQELWKIIKGLTYVERRERSRTNI